MSTNITRTNVVAFTSPPAKLNLFLELLNRRDDGFHEIDTVMVPINWRDDLRVRRTQTTDIQLEVTWAESRRKLAEQLGVAANSHQEKALLEIPNDHRNLVFRALQQFRERFKVGGGFQAELIKRIPAGAGMGGASSDAASALLCAAALCDIDPNHPALFELAANLGSDVPFFLGCGQSGSGGNDSITAARATGRGEILEPIALNRELFFVVVYPAVSLSTAKVYSLAQLPFQPQDAGSLIEHLSGGQGGEVTGLLLNRLSEPAKKLAPTIAEILESLWRSGLQACQLTGSGSACFAMTDSMSTAKTGAQQVRERLQPGAIVIDTQSTSVPAPVEII